MKKVKLAAISVGAVFLALVVLQFSKRPSYTLKTEGILYVVNKASKSITVFDLFKGIEITEIAMDQEPHEATVLANPDRVVVTDYGNQDVAGNSITVIDAQTNTAVKTLSLGESLRPHGIITLPQGNAVGVVTDIGNHLSVVNLDSGVVEKQIATKQDMSHLLVHHPVKPLIYVSNINSGSISVVDTQQDQVVQIITCSKKAEGIAIKPDGTEIWVTNIKENFISVINTDTYETTTTLATGAQPLRIAFSIDGKQCLVSNSSDGTVSLFNTETKQLIKTLPMPGSNDIVDKLIYGTPRPVGLLMHPNGKYAFVSNYTADRVEVIDMESFTCVSSISVGRMPDGLALVN